jgi:DNA-binding MarR family transcriptional regulator
MTEVSRISANEWDVWRTFTTMRRQLDLALEQQLQRDAGISRPDFEVLITIFEAPERQLRVRELVDRLGWEKSRVSHQVTRMERRGLVERSECDTDGRGSWVGLTHNGRRAVLGSMRDHASTIRRYFFDVLTPDELETVSATSHRVLDAIDPPVCQLDDRQVDDRQVDEHQLEPETTPAAAAK